jgi:hypothetical protein
MPNDWSRGHRLVFFAAAIAGTALACAERDAPRRKTDDRPNEPAAAGTSAGKTTPGPTDVSGKAAAVASANDAGVPERNPGQDDFHLDGADVEYEPARREVRAARKGRPIELILRSTPAGAIAAVDGEAVGPTPAVWEGDTDGRAREFTFVLPGYAIARYRFVPMQSGVVHGTLGRLKSDPDAGPIAPPSP